MLESTCRLLRTATVTGCAVVGLVPIAACSSGGTSTDAPPATAGAGSAADFAEAANGICREARARLDPLAADVFPATAADQRLAAFHEMLVADLDRQLLEFAALDPPPAVADEFARYLDTAGRAVETVRTGGPVGLLGDADPFTEANELARRLGFDTCVP